MSRPKTSSQTPSSKEDSTTTHGQNDATDTPYPDRQDNVEDPTSKEDDQAKPPANVLTRVDGHTVETPKSKKENLLRNTTEEKKKRRESANKKETTAKAAGMTQEPCPSTLPAATRRTTQSRKNIGENAGDAAGSC